jgi:hypothetical protein
MRLSYPDPVPRVATYWTLEREPDDEPLSFEVLGPQRHDLTAKVSTGARSPARRAMTTGE